MYILIFHDTNCYTDLLIMASFNFQCSSMTKIPVSNVAFEPINCIQPGCKLFPASLTDFNPVRYPTSTISLISPAYLTNPGVFYPPLRISSAFADEKKHREKPGVLLAIGPESILTEGRHPGLRIKKALFIKLCYNYAGNQFPLKFVGTKPFPYISCPEYSPKHCFSNSS